MIGITALRLVIAAALILATTAFLRLLYILPGIHPRHPSPPRKNGNHVLIVLGSGGHTAEMLSMLRNLDIKRYAYRTYLVQENDAFSADKARAFELALKEQQNIQRIDPSYELRTVPRARNIFQPLYTAPWSCLRCLLAGLRILSTPPRAGRYKDASTTTPDMILTNGPATGVIVVIAVLILRYFGMQGEGEMKSIYVESWARVRTLSLSGKILLKLGLTDRFLVQWEALKGGRAEWRGFLVE